MSDKNIHQRMLEVMKAVSYVQKEDKKVNNQYTFVSHDAVTAKVRPYLIEQGILMAVDVVAMTQDGNRTKAMAKVRFINADKPDDFVEVTSHGYGIDPQDKGPGKAVSYAVKYAILKSFCLETGDDPEKDSIAHKPAEVTEVKKDGTTRPAKNTLETAKCPQELTQDEFQHVKGTVEAVMDWLAAGSVTDAVLTYDNANFFAEQTVFFWTFFDSKQRTAMKLENERLTKQHKEAA